MTEDYNLIGIKSVIDYREGDEHLNYFYYIKEIYILELFS